MREKEIPTVIAGYFSNPEHCMPVYDAICSLASQYNVVVIARNTARLNYLIPERVFIYYVGSELKLGEFKPFYKTLADFILFVFKFISLTVSKRPVLFLCFDMYSLVATAIVRVFFPRAKTVYNQIETVLKSEVTPFSFIYFLKDLEIHLSKKTNILCFPERERAKLFLQSGLIKKDFMIVENCPKKLLKLPEYPDKLRKLKEAGHRFVIHRGPVGDGTTLDIHETVRSIKYWPLDSILILLGLCKEKEERLIREIANEEKVSDRLILIPFVVALEEMFGYIACASVGLVLYKPLNVNRKYVAPVKLYDYFACGVPVVVPKSLPNVCKMVNDMGVGFSYGESTPLSIGTAIREILEHPLREKMGEKARKAHLSKLNFEEQFSPLFKEIEKFAT